MEIGHSDLEKKHSKLIDTKIVDGQSETSAESVLNEADYLLFNDMNECRICKKNFSCPSNLKRHNKNVHSSKRKRPLVDSDNKPAKVALVSDM